MNSLEIIFLVSVGVAAQARDAAAPLRANADVQPMRNWEITGTSWVGIKKYSMYVRQVYSLKMSSHLFLYFLCI